MNHKHSEAKRKLAPISYHWPTNNHNNNSPEKIKS